MYIYTLTYTSTHTDLWSKENTYLEQPKVDFEHKIAYYTQDLAGSTRAWSTIPEFNSVIGYENVRIPIVKSTELDVNLDHLVDFIDFDISIPLQAGESINDITLLLFFEVTLQGRVSAIMDSMAVVQANSYLPGKELYVNGDLLFRQRNPLPARGMYEFDLHLHACGVPCVCVCFGAHMHPYIISQTVVYDVRKTSFTME